MTVHQMIEWLQKFPSDLPVVLNIEDPQSNSGVYISVCKGSEVQKVEFEEDGVSEEYLVLTPCMCSSKDELVAAPESINPN